MKKAAVVRKVQKTGTIEKHPIVGDVFFDQFKQLAVKIVNIGNTDILVNYRSGLRAFGFREIEWDQRAGWWTFKREKKEYYVWMEIVSSETSEDNRGVWEKASNVPMIRETAEVIMRLLKQDNPELDFSVSIGRPSSYSL